MSVSKILFKTKFLIICFLGNIYGHGFSKETIVYLNWSSPFLIEDLVQKYKKNKNINLVSRKEDQSAYSSRKIKSIGRSTTDFSVKIWFDEDTDEDDIVCTPAQEFLLYDTLCLY